MQKTTLVALHSIRSVISKYVFTLAARNTTVLKRNQQLNNCLDDNLLSRDD